jgi:hypothetical protein
VVTPTSGRANGLNMPPPLMFMTSTTLYYNNYKKKKKYMYIHKKELKKILIQIVDVTKHEKTRKYKKEKNDLK